MSCRHVSAEHPSVALTQVAKLDRAPRAPIVTVYTKADLVSLAARPPDRLTAVSAVTREGLDTLLDTLRTHLPDGPSHYDPDEMATQPMRFFAAEFVRE